MPRVLEIEDVDSCSIEECVEAIEAARFDPNEEESLQHAALWLRRLANNRTFLGDLLIEELKQQCEGADLTTAYGPQAIMLASHSEDFFLRANIWPAADDPLLQASGMASFVYGMPHDHNFDFLTVGYLGPGYWSEYYEYDYSKVHGWIGEAAGLRFVERSRLEPEKLMHYRAHRDIHRQLPPDALSVSLNVMHSNPAQGWLDQYRFDLDHGTIAGIVNRGSSEALLKIGVALGNQEAFDVAEQFARNHPSDRMRLSAWDAVATALRNDLERDELWAQAEQSGSRLVAKEAKRRRAALAAV